MFRVTMRRDASESEPKMEAVKALLGSKFLIGFEEPDLSSLEGLSEEDLDALEELKDLKPEEVKALSETKPDEKDQAIEKLKATLHKERVERRRLAKELKAVQPKPGSEKPPTKKGKDEEEEEGESSESIAKHQAELQKERQRSERLAEQFATNAVDTTILKVLSSGGKNIPKFQDGDDVIRLIDRTIIDVDQEDDDLSKVEVDEDTVRDALKKLAKSKSHLLLKEEKEGGEEEAGGGSKFGGPRKGGSEKDREAELKRKYPALGRR